MKRTLTLKTERLAELTADELAGVAGADASGQTCVAALCRPSDVAISLCGCLTHYCSIDIC